LHITNPVSCSANKTLQGDTRRTVFDAVPGGNERLSVVGRLDFESEGLVILTN